MKDVDSQDCYHLLFTTGHLTTTEQLHLVLSDIPDATAYGYCECACVGIVTIDLDDHEVDRQNGKTGNVIYIILGDNTLFPGTY